MPHEQQPLSFLLPDSERSQQRGRTQPMAGLRCDLIAQAMRALPPPAAKEQRAEIIAEFDPIGGARLLAIVKKAPSRYSHLYWAVQRAEMAV